MMLVALVAGKLLKHLLNVALTRNRRVAPILKAAGSTA